MKSYTRFSVILFGVILNGCGSPPDQGAIHILQQEEVACLPPPAPCHCPCGLTSDGSDCEKCECDCGNKADGSCKACPPPLPTPICGGTFADRQTVNAYATAPGQTGTWWCDAHFGGNLGGKWQCLSVSGGACDADAPLNSAVNCGRLRFSDVQIVNAYATAPGQTGTWWCDAHFGGNLGGSWLCISVAPGSCESTAPKNAAVQCGRCSGT